MYKRRRVNQNDNDVRLLREKLREYEATIATLIAHMRTLSERIRQLENELKMQQPPLRM